MKLTTALLIVLLGSKNVPPSRHSSGATVADSKDLGALADGKYSNDVLGISLDLPSGWEIDRPGAHPEPRGELLIRLSAQLDRMIVSGTRLDPDEQLSETFHWSLRGAADGGGFKTVGAQAHEIRDGRELLSQKLKRIDGSGPVTAIYIGFFNRGYYTSILLFGPAKTEESRAAILKSLTLLAGRSSERKEIRSAPPGNRETRHERPSSSGMERMDSLGHGDHARRAGDAANSRILDGIPDSKSLYR